MLRSTLAVLALSFLVTAAHAQTETVETGTVLLIDKIDRDSPIATPQHGAKMEQVMRDFGEPIEKRRAVGDPPIARWIYDDFIVFFEYDTVIRSVIPKD